MIDTFSVLLYDYFIRPRGDEMDGFAKKYAVKAEGSAFADNVFVDGNLRLTVITPELIRIEKGGFCNLPTQTVLFRNLGRVDFSTEKIGDRIILKTKKCEFDTDKSGKLRSVRLPDGRVVKSFKKGNLKGTRRTLDVTFGRVKLGDGIISRGGVALLDDSNSLNLLNDGTVVPRSESGTDFYVFAYGSDYKDALRDFYRITGETPLIPRFCLGNWWSRYWRYSQEEYLELTDKFEEKNIPLTVACVDMDWHWTDVEKRFGEKVWNYPKPKNPVAKMTGCFWNPGWTGYSWNTELFPNHVEFLNALHEKGLKINLNVHPAQGVRFFEDMYPDFAKDMKIDEKSGETIEFDFTDKSFVDGYFKYINTPAEKEGVDFWWIDWQQGNRSKIEGLDPLWLLNHYYCLDRQSKGLRPLTLSRFAGFGSHRYPLGFSGDTAIRWSVLDFQPYFTATAANAGYSWWSHDIGGHNFGKRDDELYTRWVQFGVFSPIMRFHSVNDALMGKEPWKYSGSAEKTVTEFLRLRHRMIPYTYTMNRLTETEGRPLLMPMYYEYPDDSRAYEVGNEYFFGTQLIAVPMTRRADRITNTASAEVWLPEGRFTDIFTGRIYNGGRKFHMCRDASLIPVLAPSGAIIPLDGRTKGNDCNNPETFELLIYRGNGTFRLYEDDGESLGYRDGHFAETQFKVEENEKGLAFCISPAEDDLTLIPDSRSYILSFRDIASAEKIRVTDGEDSLEFNCQKHDGGISVTVDNVKSEKGVTVTLLGVTVRKNPSRRELITEALSKVQGDIFFKSLKYKKCLAVGFDGKISAPKSVRHMLEEIMNME